MNITRYRIEKVINSIVFCSCRRWGSADCIDRLIMSGLGTSKIYGKMVFKSDAYISLLLNGSEQPVQYFINGKPIWVQKYVTRVVVN